MPTQEEISYFQEHQQSVREQENFEVTAEALLLTSTLSTTYSEASVLLNNNGVFPVSVAVFNQKSDSIDPEYNWGFRVKSLYRIPPTRNSLYGSYTYIYNNGDGHLKSDSIHSIQNGSTQQNIQDDKGRQHVHLHIADLIVSRRFPMYEHISFLLGGGLSYNDFYYFFRFHNQDEIINRDINGTVLSDFTADLRSQRKIRCWGLGPKIEWHFGFHFTKMDWRHDVSVNMAVQLATLFGKLWGRGNFSSVGTGESSGFPLTPTLNNNKWTNSPKFQVIPNVNFDLSLRYKYEWPQKVSLLLAMGYRAYLYWELQDFNRTVNYRIYSQAFVSDVGTSTKDTALFAGPYLRFTVGF